MKIRKIVLLTAIAVLLCVYIAQLLQTGKNPVKTLTLLSEPDTYTITTADNTVVLKKNGDAWTVGDKNYPANESYASSIADIVKNVKVLDTVSHSDSETEKERYGLQAGTSFTVTASLNGKTLRTITVGKASSTSSQTYIKVDDAKDIYIASGSYKNVCEKSVSDLRSKSLYSVSADTITHVAISNSSGAWEMDKSGEPLQWTLSGNDGDKDVTADKLSSFVNSLASVNVQSWIDDGEVVLDTASTTSGIMRLTAGDTIITMNVYQIEEGDDKKYIGTSSKTPYMFYLPKYIAEKITEKPADF